MPGSRGLFRTFRFCSRRWSSTTVSVRPRRYPTSSASSPAKVKIDFSPPLSPSPPPLSLARAFFLCFPSSFYFPLCSLRLLAIALTKGARDTIAPWSLGLIALWTSAPGPLKAHYEKTVAEMSWKHVKICTACTAIRHLFEPISTHFPARHHPPHALRCALVGAHAYRMPTGAFCTLILCPSHVSRA